MRVPRFRKRRRFQWHPEADARDLEELDRGQKAVLAAHLEHLDSRTRSDRGIRRIRTTSVDIDGTKIVVLYVVQKNETIGGLAVIECPEPTVSAYELAQNRLDEMSDW